MKVLSQFKSNNKTKMEDVPDGDTVASYIEALKLHLQENKIKNDALVSLVKQLPPQNKVRSELSKQEIAILFESVRFAWKEITKQDIVTENKIERAPETLNGNYWMIRKGVLLEGPNHFTIIRKNMDMIASLLNIDPFVLHEKMAGHPDGLIKTVIDNGGIRIFVNKDRKAFFQLTDTTYSAWGRNKIRKYDFKDKIVKVIDKKQPYKGWKSGITVVL